MGGEERRDPTVHPAPWTSIEEATVITSGGATLPVTLSPVIEEFGLRFGAAALPEEDPPETLSVRLADERVITSDVPWPRRPPMP